LNKENLEQFKFEEFEVKTEQEINESEINQGFDALQTGADEFEDEQNKAKTTEEDLLTKM
jgi:hypothetical protein